MSKDEMTVLPLCYIDPDFSLKQFKGTNEVRDKVVIQIAEFLKTRDIQYLYSTLNLLEPCSQKRRHIVMKLLEEERLEKSYRRIPSHMYVNCALAHFMCLHAPPKKKA